MKKKPKQKAKILLKGAKIIDLSLWLEKQKILVIADLHLGFEEALNKQGFFVPRFNFSETKKRLEGIFSKTGKAKKIIVLGDLKHEFGRISEQEWSEVIETINFLQKSCKEIILLKGNHDTILGPLASWKNLQLRDFYYLKKEKILFLHGNKINFFGELNQAKTIVMGHEHPAIALREGAKHEKFKCFLKGKFEGKELVVLPSFNSFSAGTDMYEGKTLSPFLSKGTEEFEVWAIEEGKVFYLGKIKELE